MEYIQRIKITLNKNINNIIALLLIFFAASAWADIDDISLPNVVFIFADDLGYADVGPIKLPNSPVITQHIDQLAEEGMLFTDAHTASAVCAPSRYSVMTGNYPFRGRKRWGTWNYQDPSQILNEQDTVADVLKAANYHTAFIGKWHMGGDYFKKNSNTFYRGNDPSQVDFNRRFHNGPLDHGFDYSFTLPSGIQSTPFAYFENDKYVPMVPSQPELVWLPNGPYTRAGFGDSNWDSREAGIRLANKAVDFIDSHNQQYGTQKPFFLYYASQAPHGPYTPPVEFDGEPVEGVTGLLPRLDLVVELDLQVGKIIKALEDRGLDNNTLIIFTSDNGGFRSSPTILAGGHDSVNGLRGQKGQVYDGGHRVPFIAKWGDGTNTGSIIPPGSVNNQLIAVHDWVAAMYELTNQQKPADQARDSVNILPLLLGDLNEPARSSLIVDASAAFGPQIKWRTIRDGDWALLLDPVNNPKGLYNMATDLKQTNNLVNAPAQANRVIMLRDLYLNTINSMADPCGQPSYNAATERGIFLWKNCTTQQWFMRSTGGGSNSVITYQGLFDSDQNFISVDEISLEPNDELEYEDDPTDISYVFKMIQGGQDGIDFTFPSGANVCFNPSVLPDGATVLLGSGRTPVTGSLDLVTLDSCSTFPSDTECGQPSYNKATQQDILIWKDCTGTPVWHLRATGGGTNSVISYEGEISSDQDFTDIVSFNLENDDILTNMSDPDVINYSLILFGTGQDGFEFKFPASAKTCFDTTSVPTGSKVLLGAGRTEMTVPFDLENQTGCM